MRVRNPGLTFLFPFRPAPPPVGREIPGGLTGYSNGY